MHPQGYAFLVDCNYCAVKIGSNNMHFVAYCGAYAFVISMQIISHITTRFLWH